MLHLKMIPQVGKLLLGGLKRTHLSFDHLKLFNTASKLLYIVSEIELFIEGNEANLLDVEQGVDFGLQIPDFSIERRQRFSVFLGCAPHYHYGSLDTFR